jgi:hypothetical protein
MKINYLLLVVFTIYSCNFTKTSKQTLNVKKEFHFEDYEIAKGRLGDIKPGETIQSNISGIYQMDVKQVPAYQFGFDGGGVAYLYSFKSEPVFALIPAYHTDSIIAVVAIHEKLKGPKSIHPKMTVTELKQLYPKTKIGYNLLMDWEELYDDKNDFSFVFMTKSPNLIGNYVIPDRTESVPANNLDCKSDWITIY